MTSLDLMVHPLSDKERGRGVHLSRGRVEELKAECYRLVKMGFSQKQICTALNASRSRVSRWCGEVVRLNGTVSDRRLIKGIDQTLPQMLWARVQIGDGCWNWIGHVRPNGYGTLNFKGRVHYAHRAFYQLLVSEITSDLVVDHICENRRCVNPNHLRPVTQNENLYCANMGRKPRD